MYVLTNIQLVQPIKAAAAASVADTAVAGALREAQLAKGRQLLY